MLNILRVDFKRYFMTNSLRVLAILAAVLQPLFMQILMHELSKLIGQTPVITINDFAVYSGVAAIYLAIFITLFLHTEAGEGILRNKIISGKKRYQVLISYCSVNAVLAAVLQVVSVLTTAAMAKIYGSQITVTFAEVLRFTVVTTLAGIAISVFYTVVYMCFCTQKFAIALPATIAVAMRFSMFFILDALYTAIGTPKVSGFTLKLYTGIDRFVPFYHLTGWVRHDNLSYLAGDIAVIVISLVIGSIVFSKKDLK